MPDNRKICFCLVTHKYDDFVRSHWIKILSDLRDTNVKPVIMYDSTKAIKAEIDSLWNDADQGLFSQDSIFLFDEANVRNKLENIGYDLRQYEPADTLFYGNIMAAYMCFFIDNQEYDYYWFKEYDVDYTGSWKTLVEKYDTIDDDFLSRSSEVGSKYRKDWYHYGKWNTTSVPKFNDSEVIVTFNPITRFSFKALKYLDKVYREGNSGFYELFLGTVLKNRANFKVSGFREYGDLDIEGFTYIPMGGNLPSSIKYKANKLYHPVKKHIDFKIDA